MNYYRFPLLLFHSHEPSCATPPLLCQASPSLSRPFDLATRVTRLLLQGCEREDGHTSRMQDNPQRSWRGGVWTGMTRWKCTHTCTHTHTHTHTHTCTHTCTRTRTHIYMTRTCGKMYYAGAVFVAGPHALCAAVR